MMVTTPPPTSAVSVAQVASQAFGQQPISTPQGPVPLSTVMVAIAGAESGWNPSNQGDYGLGTPSCHGYTSFGLWQIHLPSWGDTIQRLSSVSASNPCAQASWLYAPQNNAKVAATILGSNPQAKLTNWSTWGTYGGTTPPPGHGTYLQYLSSAERAMATANPSASGVSYQGSGIKKLPWWLWLSLGSGSLIAGMAFAGYVRSGRGRTA